MLDSVEDAEGEELEDVEDDELELDMVVDEHELVRERKNKMCGGQRLDRCRCGPEQV